MGLSRTSLYALVERSTRVRKAAEIERPEVEAVLAEHGGDIRKAAAHLEVSAHALKLRIRALNL